MEDAVSMPENVENALELHSLRFIDFLAESPKQFKECRAISYTRRATIPPSLTNRGLELELPLIPVFTEASANKGEAASWIGLLNSRAVAKLGFPGILLQPIAGSEGFFYRTAFGTQSYSTVLVNARVAAQAIPKKVTIIQKSLVAGSSATLIENNAMGFIVINRLNFIRTAYSISHVSCVEKGVTRTTLFNTRWNASSEILTLQETFLIDTVYVFSFKSQQGYPDFSVVIWGFEHNDVDKVVGVMRNGPSLYDEELNPIWKYREATPTSDRLKAIEEKTVLLSQLGEMCPITAVVKGNRVGGNIICVVDIDIWNATNALEVNGPPVNHPIS